MVMGVPPSRSMPSAVGRVWALILVPRMSFKVAMGLRECSPSGGKTIGETTLTACHSSATTPDWIMRQIATLPAVLVLYSKGKAVTVDLGNCAEVGPSSPNARSATPFKTRSYTFA